MNIFNDLVLAKNKVTMKDGIISGYIDMPHSLWVHYRQAGKRKFKTKKGEDYEIYIKKVIPFSIKGKVKINLNFYFSNNSLNDIDNRFKALFDSLTYANIIEDDSLIVNINVNKYTPSVITDTLKIKKPVGFTGACYIEISPFNDSEYDILKEIVL